jgi:hypothetical protein
MSQTIRSPAGFSALIDAYLLVNGQRIAAEQIYGETLILREEAELAPGTAATLVLCIDGCHEEREIVLTEGHPAGSRLPIKFSVRQAESSGHS